MRVVQRLENHIFFVNLVGEVFVVDVVLRNFYLFNSARQSRLPVFGAENAAKSALTDQRFS